MIKQTEFLMFELCTFNLYPKDPLFENIYSRTLTTPHLNIVFSR